MPKFGYILNRIHGETRFRISFEKRTMRNQVETLNANIPPCQSQNTIDISRQVERITSLISLRDASRHTGSYSR